MAKKVYKRLDEEDRMVIQACLHKKMSLEQVASQLKVSKSTISRELKRNAIIKKANFNLACEKLKRDLVCNTCAKKGYCQLTKRYYDFRLAIDISKNRNVAARSITQLDEQSLLTIDEIVTEGVRLGQSLHHIYISNPILKTLCCERTIRRLVYRGNLSIKPHQLRQYVVYKRFYTKDAKQVQLRDISALIGRTFKEYLRYSQNHKRDNIVQYDSLIGKMNDKQALLTITFVKYAFQFGLLIKKSSPSSVNSKIRKLFHHLGEGLVKQVFAINLADNGTEFSYFHQLENSDQGEVLIKTFYTNPYKATDKAEAERNHGLVRYFLPKGKSLDNLKQADVDLMFSHLNSYIRQSRGDRAPYDLVKDKFGKDLLDKLNIQRISNKKVKLRAIV